MTPTIHEGAVHCRDAERDAKRVAVKAHFDAKRAAKVANLEPECYACDAQATGSCDRTHHAEGTRVPACDRHRDSKAKPWNICPICLGPTRPGSVVIEGQAYHAKCHKADCEDRLPRY